MQGKAWEKERGRQCTWSPGSNRSAGVAVLIHPNSAATLVDSKTHLADRVVTALIDFHRQRFQIMNVYGPNNHRECEIFFDNLWCFKYPNLESIVVGDFNCVLDIALDKWGSHVIFLEKAVMQLHSFTGSLALEDFYHVSNPSGNIFTWFNGPYSVGCRLDRFYTPRAWRSRITRHACLPFSYSNHQLIQLQVTFGPTHPGVRGYGNSTHSCSKTKVFAPQSSLFGLLGNQINLLSPTLRFGGMLENCN